MGWPLSLIMFPFLRNIRQFTNIDKRLKMKPNKNDKVTGEYKPYHHQINHALNYSQRTTNTDKKFQILC